MSPSRLSSDYSDSASATQPSTKLTTPTTDSPRFFGKLNTSMIESKFLSHPEDLGIVAVGFSGGQGKPGVDAAPTALIESGLLTQLRDELGYTLHGHEEVQTYTDLVPAADQDPPHRGMKNPRAVSAVTRRIAEQVYAQAREGRLVLTLGGDHSIAIGTIAGSAKATRERLGRELAVIWVDAHADINTPETSGSGNVHGMPVSFLTGLAREDKEEFFGWLTDEHRVSVKKLVYIGLRDVDAGEKRILRENGIRAFSMFDIDRWVTALSPSHSLCLG
jgi:arginase